MRKQVEDQEALEQTLREAVEFFETAQIPKQMILSECETIVNTQRFIDTTLATLRKFWKNKELREPYLKRFLKVYELIKTNIYVKPSAEIPERKIAITNSYESPSRKVAKPKATKKPKR